MKGIIEKFIIKGILGVSIFFYFILSLSSELPVKFIYQGNLREKGILITGIRQMQFSMYETQNSTLALWTSPLMNVTISTGVFRVTIEPNLSREYLNKVLYLELSVEGQKLSPREEILPSVYSINTLYHEGKRYYTFSSPPDQPEVGDLWFNTNDKNLYYYNGNQWVSVSIATPQQHHQTHEPGGNDEIKRLGTINFEGNIILSSSSLIRSLSNYVNVSTNLVVNGFINVSSSVYANEFIGDGSMLINLSGQNIIDGTISKAKLSPCNNFGEILMYNGSSWICANINMPQEIDPWSIKNYSLTGSSQTSSFWISSGTVDYFYVKDEINIYQTAKINPSNNGFFVNSNGNVGIGVFNPTSKFEVVGSVNIDSGNKDAFRVDDSGRVGVGTDTPISKFEVVGEDQSGIISTYRAGNKQIGFFRRK